MLQTSNLPSLNPVNAPLVRPPQAKRTRRGRLYRRRNKLPIRIDELINKPNETNIPIAPPNEMPVEPPKEIPVEPPKEMPVAPPKEMPITPPKEIPVAPPNEMPNQNMSNPRNIRLCSPTFVVGYRGEAFVYEMLNKEEKFKTVKWNALSDDRTNRCVTTVNGTTYYIKEDGLPYDLLAIDENDEKYYIEVKSTLANAKDVSISHCQAELARKLSNLNEHHVVAVVFNVDKNPSVIYYKKMNSLA